MNASAKTQYACIAVLELATRHHSGEPVRLRQIADKHGIPARFLVQILLQLKAAGLVSSTRGAAGGYQLSKHPGKITLGEVMDVIDGQVGELTSHCSEQTALAAVLLEAWQEVTAVEREMLDSVTFEQLAQQSSERAENMYYI